MLLTKKKLKEYQENMIVIVPSDLEKKLLTKYGEIPIDSDGLIREYTEQDIYEQLRKILMLK